MPIDPSTYQLQNVTDTCSVWNVLSSTIISTGAHLAGVRFVCTDYVVYECLHKPRKATSLSDEELQSRLIQAREAGRFQSYSLDLEDLQDLEILAQRKNLGKGELSTLAYARKARLAMLTDDQSARRYAIAILGHTAVQTTPHLVGWLFYYRHIDEGRKEELVREHIALGRPLGAFFEIAYLEAFRCRLLAAKVDPAP